MITHVYASAVTLASAYFSDRYRARAVPTMIVAILAVAGFSLYLGKTCFCFQGPVKQNHSPTLGSHSVGVAYGSLFLSVPGVYATPPIIAAWMANNSEPHYRRATSVAIGFVATNAVSP